MWKNLRKRLNLPESYVSITLGFLVVLVAGILAFNYFSANKSDQPSVQKQDSEKTVEEKMAELPKMYKVVEGDNLWKIAENYYGSGYNWVSIVEANDILNPDYVTEGQELTLPKAEVIKLENGEMIAAASTQVKEYTVVAGDNLWSIAVNQLGDGYAWSQIANLNNLVNPDLIHPGNVLKLP